LRLQQLAKVAAVAGKIVSDLYVHSVHNSEKSRQECAPQVSMATTPNIARAAAIALTIHTVLPACQSAGLFFERIHVAKFADQPNHNRQTAATTTTSGFWQSSVCGGKQRIVHGPTPSTPESPHGLAFEFRKNLSCLATTGCAFTSASRAMPNRRTAAANPSSVLQRMKR